MATPSRAEVRSLSISRLSAAEDGPKLPDSSMSGTLAMFSPSGTTARSATLSDQESADSYRPLAFTVARKTPPSRGIGRPSALTSTRSKLEPRVAATSRP